VNQAAPTESDDRGPASGPLLRLEDVVKHFTVRKRGLLAAAHTVHAVDAVSLDVAEGETLGIVGESGCGKSTLARVAVGLYKPTAGSVYFDGTETSGTRRTPRAGWQPLQMVFQDPTGSLNPRISIGESVAEPLRARGVNKVRGKVHEILDLVALKPEFADRLPHQLSGGQQQRACIARALIGEPRLVVHDESVSALDVSLQAQVLNLLRDLQERLGLTYIFISHDLATVQSISRRVAVMYLGKIVELAPSGEFNARPLHPYSIALRSAVPVPDPKVERRRARIILRGDVPSPLAPPPGCRFHTRCPIAQDVCRNEEPPMVEHRTGHWAACHFAGQVDKAMRPIAVAGTAPEVD
jgi:oligopeptide/dipeptide ABC transporter ATP-binding protein